ncbi:hypothetical protein EHI8A_080450 [Entamoeba histolytica HM-1:IMSS-B]|uniref:PPM-type phosphatase domain-containing protein n=6 Tax=Entamoeba histolytica TaxID=5759 RepID=C4LU04_ENTH1|nr:hypothetical protein, conserved [Entamoeba histolytica HM-1:IMSS]EMD42429.1 Hypothetical protein EHI5A_114930 [Entamoeba histolytica KU27]EMH75491.1 hypothetical protein EHI8A_080450 [Entamoeba histolytica HM-1:IMSS-B]ENY60055.1 hypothetical protein EHI7A_079090 [Entamoeba histolytica HM-1:IMSS-A]GAT92070.1 hypothetical protein conserved [Entamoeba histolytica]EAL51376.1 hypothetical protein, conserved [Entamoeba histolytica HM-1:IMSS]|eukprot:XP_656761.1 hypothetical protein, conserved [Entamoeba histolytica HM-1:IMSS]
MEGNSSKIFNKKFKPFLKDIPNVEIKSITTRNFSKHIIEDYQEVLGYDQSFSLSSFSTYPCFKNVKQGEPNCDCIGIQRFTNCTVMVVADGCGWGVTSARAAHIAVETVLSSMFNEVSKCVRLHEIANALVSSTYQAHDRIQQHHTKILPNSTCTILTVITVTSTQPYTLILSVGDCEAFIYKSAIGRTFSINKKWCRSIKSTQECGGRIGNTPNLLPELTGAYLKVIDVELHDIIIVTSDGFADNLRLQKENVSPQVILDTVISPRIQSCANLNEFVVSMDDFIIKETEDAREFHSQNQNRIRKQGLKGKLDHATIGVYSISSFNTDIGLIDSIFPDILTSIYPSNVNRTTRSHSFSVKDLVPTTEIPLKTKFKCSSVGEIQEPNDSKPIIYPQISESPFRPIQFSKLRCGSLSREISFIHRSPYRDISPQRSLQAQESLPSSLPSSFSLSPQNSYKPGNGFIQFFQKDH